MGAPRSRLPHLSLSLSRGSLDVGDVKTRLRLVLVALVGGPFRFFARPTTAGHESRGRNPPPP